MYFASPLLLYADKNFYETLKTIQLQWESRGEVTEILAVFLAEQDEEVSGMNTLLQWVNMPPPFDVKAMSWLASAKDESGVNVFGESFLNFLQRFRFTGDLWAAPDGTKIFISQPIVQIRGTSLQLSIIQHWIQHLVKPESYLQTVEKTLQIRRYYNPDGQLIQDIIYSLNTPPIVNFEAANREDLLQPVKIENRNRNL